MYHHLGGADLHTLAAADAVFLVNHINAGFRVLGDCIMLAGLHALAALDAHIGLCPGPLGNNLNAAVGGIKLLVECNGAGADTLQASHALGIFFYRELLHDGNDSFYVFYIYVVVFFLLILYTNSKK